MGGHHSPKSETEIWLTPPEIIAALGPFDLDPCAAPEPRPWPTAAEHITLPADGLASPWPKKKRVWFNPPYSTIEMRRWLPAMVEHGNGTGLIFARTETDAFFEHVWDDATSVLFLRGRLHFHFPDGRRADNNSGGPSVLVAYGAYNSERLRTCGFEGKFIQLKDVGVFA